MIAALHLHMLQPISHRHIRYPPLAGHQRYQIPVGDLRLPVRQVLERLERLVQLILIQVIAQLIQPRPQPGAAAQLAQHQFVARQPYGLRIHNLKSGALFQHAVLVNPRRVAEGVSPHNRLVRLHGKARDVAHEAACAVNLPRIDVRGHPVHIAPRLQRHNHLLQRRVPRALAQPVDAALNLPRALNHRRQAIADRLPQIVVAMHAQRSLADVRHILFDEPDALAELPRHHIPHRVRHIDSRGARRDSPLQHLVEVIHIRARGVHRGKLHIVAVRLGALH